MLQADEVAGLGSCSAGYNWLAGNSTMACVSYHTRLHVPACVCLLPYYSCHSPGTTPQHSISPGPRCSSVFASHQIDVGACCHKPWKLAYVACCFTCSLVASLLVDWAAFRRCARRLAVGRVPPGRCGVLRPPLWRRHSCAAANDFCLRAACADGAGGWGMGRTVAQSLAVPLCVMAASRARRAHLSTSRLHTVQALFGVGVRSVGAF